MVGHLAQKTPSGENIRTPGVYQIDGHDARFFPPQHLAACYNTPDRTSSPTAGNSAMKIEHVAFNVPDPPALARWYVEHLGLTVKLQLDQPPFTRFLADDGGAVMVEFYCNTEAPLPDYRRQDPRTLHLALVSADVAADRQRLIDAGATAVGDVQRLEDGTLLAMLRDPWGLAVQLVRRARPMI
jgi:catechol 2,3-dioxygenase-like lactoylglutathione lyase family enzyme